MSRVTALHEAGHVVAAILCGEGVYNAQIATRGATLRNRRGVQVLAHGMAELTLNAGPPQLVRLSLAAAPQRYATARARAFNAVFCDGAGPAAEAKARRPGLASVWLGWGAGGDLESSDRALEPFVEDARERMTAIRQTWEAAAKVIGRSPVWQAVEAVAAKLTTGVTDGGELTAAARAALPDAPTTPIWAEGLELPVVPRGAGRP